MEFDNYVIDTDVAQSDIAKMNQAVELLNQARYSITQLMGSAENMQGETINAILEKSSELQKRIDILTRQLQNSTQLINQTVNHYLSIDAAHASAISK